MSIACALCGRTAVRYYPARRAVREKLSGRHYCSDEHSKRHWAIRNQQERQASKEAYPCLGPDCREWIEPRPGPGRPADYCSVSCREAARRERDRPVAGAVARAMAVLQEAQLEADEGAAIEARTRAASEAWMETNVPAIAELLALGSDYYEEAERQREEWLSTLRSNAAELAELQQKAAAAAAELRKAEERLARRAKQARERRARKAAERDRKRTESDPEFREWLDASVGARQALQGERCTALAPRDMAHLT